MSEELRTYPMTASTLEKLRAELKHKKEVERIALAARLKAAIEMGDLSENAEYISAKEDQAFLEGRIQELQAMIDGHMIIKENEKGDGTVQLGSQVIVLEEGMDELETFMIVGAVEANPMEGKISNESPLGQALLGAVKGDVVQIDAPDGAIKFKINEVK